MYSLRSYNEAMHSISTSSKIKQNKQTARRRFHFVSICCFSLKLSCDTQYCILSLAAQLWRNEYRLH